MKTLGTQTLSLTKKAVLCAATVAPMHAVAAENSNSGARIEVASMLTVQPNGLQVDEGEVAQQQIGAVAIRGNEAIEDSRYQAIVEDFFGEPLTEDVLERLTDELVQLAREEGFEYAGAEVDTSAAERGIISVKIDEGVVDGVRIEGSDNAMARRMLERLVGGPVTKQQLETLLLKVSDIPGLKLRGARLVREDANRILVVRLTEDHQSGRLSADNYGTENFGPIRMRMSTRFSEVFSSADEIRTAVRINPIEPDELLFSSVSYRTVLLDNGTSLQVSGSLGSTAPGEVEGGDISGETARAAISLSSPLLRTKRASVWADIDAAYIEIKQDDLGALLRDDTVATASIGIRTRFALAGGGYIGTGTSLERGLGILGATRLGDPAASRSDGDGVFTKFRFNMDGRVPVADQFDAYFALAGQLADRPLLASEELGLGGPYRVRGYDFAEVLGDEGIYGLAELRYRVDTSDTPISFLQFYTFVDGGYVSDIDQTGGEGSLFSAGSGVRGRVGILDFELESAFPLGGSGERTDSSSPQVNVRAGVNF